MRKTGMYIYFKEEKAPIGYVSLVSYVVKENAEDHYKIYGDLIVSKDDEGTDYIIEDMEKEGFKNKNKHKKEAIN